MVADAGLKAFSGDPSLPDPYQIVSISSVAPPSGTSGAEWFRYEISQGDNRIVGYRSGAAVIVREAVELIVERLNIRRMHKRGRVHVILQSASNQRLQ